MTRFKLRPYTSTDTKAVVDIINMESMQTVGFPRAVVDGVGNLRLHRYIPPASEGVVATNESNEIIGYAYFTNRDNNIVTETAVAVHPAYRDQGVGNLLIEWAEEKAQNASQHALAGVRTVLQSLLFETETTAIQLLENYGYNSVREWVHLFIELQESPIVRSLPSGLTLREMDLDNDWDIVGPAMDEAFANHWGSIPAEYLESENDDEPDQPEHNEDTSETLTDDSYSNAPGYCFIVLDGETVVGGVLCNAKLVERNDTGRVGSIFVRPDYQRQGIAKALMLAAFDALWKNGIQRIITDTDANSFSDSTRLYTGLGMKLYRSEFTFEKEIRPGREVRKLEV